MKCLNGFWEYGFGECLVKQRLIKKGYYFYLIEMTMRYSSIESLKHVPPTETLKYYIRPQPLNRREIIKKVAETSMGRTITQSSCFINLPETIVPKISVSKSSSYKTERQKYLRFGEFRASDVKSLQIVKRHRAKHNVRILTQTNPQSSKIHTIKSMIDKIVLNNRNKNNHLNESKQKFNTLPSQHNETSTNLHKLKATQQYYSIKRYYQQKYSTQ